MKASFSIFASLITFLCCGCANMTVTKVTSDNEETVKGIQYHLQRPFILAAPQADGTATMDLVYLPDNSETYAIDTSTWMASSTFQVSLGPGGTLSAVEFKQNSSAVGQQLAAGVAGATAQAYNIQSAQLVASQTAVNSAQSAYDTQKAATDAAQAQLNADQSAAAPVATTIATDAGNLAQAQAKLKDTQDVLDRVRNTAQAVAVTASAASPLTTTPPTPGTTGFGPQTWTQPSPYSLPENHGAVLYALVEGVARDAAGTLKPFVSLKAVTYNGSTQPDFDTMAIALGPPTLQPQNMRYPINGATAIFHFNRPIESVSTTMQSLTMGTPVAPVASFNNPKYAKLSAGQFTQLELPIDYLAAGQYTLTVSFNADGGHSYTTPITFFLY